MAPMQVAKELCHGNFQVFWQKLPQIRTKYLCHTGNAYKKIKTKISSEFLKRK